VSEHAAASALLRAAEGELTLKISGQIDAYRLCDEVVKFRIPSHHRGHDRHIYFKDYAPQAYRRIRQLFGVSARRRGQNGRLGVGGGKAASEGLGLPRYALERRGPPSASDPTERPSVDLEPRRAKTHRYFAASDHKLTDVAACV